MNVRAAFRRFISARTTIALLCVLGVMLLLNVALPQQAVLGLDRYQSVLRESGPVAHFFLETLGFGHMATSPIFLAALGLFFLNLAAVLVARIGPTWRRIALKPRAAEGLEAWARMEESFTAPVTAEFGPRIVARSLRGFGFQVRKAGERTFWGVKHRTAPLGFLLFHLSFFLLFAGGLLIFYTRFVGVVVLSEGQEFDGTYSEVVRQPRLGDSPGLTFSVESIETELENGQPVYLEATLHLRQPGASTKRNSRINHPARWGTTSILVERAGVAPVLWLQDPAGFTLDRVVTPVKTRSEEPTVVTMAEDRFNLVVSPLGPEADFPNRDELPQTSLYFQLIGEDETLWSGQLAPGEAASFEGGRLVLEELRYWVGARVVSERGGGFLIAGFTAGILGLIWRLLWYRREVAVTWDESEFRLVGRSEYFSERFRSELEGIFQTLQRGETT